MADYSVAQLCWAEAAKHLQDSMAVHRRVQRRAQVPFLARQVVELNILAGKLEDAHAMIPVIKSYQAEKKKWGDDDRWALRFAETADTKFAVSADGSITLPAAESCEWKPRLDVWKRIILHKQLGRFMTQEAVEELKTCIRDYLTAAEDSYLQCACYTLLADLALQSGSFQASLDACNALESCAAREGQQKTDQEKRLREEGFYGLPPNEVIAPQMASERKSYAASSCRLVKL
eukprot:4595432-Amphidinium_carterae.3